MQITIAMKHFVAAVCLLGYTAALATGAEQLESKRAKLDTPADTDPNSNFWRGVPAVFAERDTSGNPVPGYRTEIRSRWTDRNLYFLFICPYEQLNLKPQPKTQSETNELWKWDVAEVFIGSDPRNIRRYKEFEVSPQGEWVDLDIDLDSQHRENGWLWNSGFEPSARIDSKTKTFYAFMRIPYQAIDSRPANSSNVLRINLYRSHGPAGNHKSINWQPTHGRSFHVPESFGELKLVE